jgi:lipopolysaccharide biosynthesis glycosyltransferase
VVLSKGHQYREQINKFNQYFELKIQTEQRTEKFPFERDACIIHILNQRLEKLKAERAEASL